MHRGLGAVGVGQLAGLLQQLRLQQFGVGQQPGGAGAFGSRLVPTSTMARTGLILNLLAVILLTLLFELWITPWLGIESGVPDWAVR